MIRNYNNKNNFYHFKNGNMYKIIENNFEQSYQRELCQLVYLDRAKDRCQIFALDYVIQKEGIGFLNRQGHKIRDGYNLKIKNTPFYIKITVLRKEPDGYFSSGALIKVTQFVTIKIKPTVPDARESLFEANIYFDEVMNELKLCRPEYQQPARVDSGENSEPLPSPNV